MKTILKMAALAFACAGLTNCYTDIKDGKVPGDYISMAQAYTGTFTGQIGGQNVAATLQISDDGEAFLAIKGADGAPISVDGCLLTYGALVGADISREDKILRQADFRLVQSCRSPRIAGRVIELSFKGTDQILLNIDKTVRTRRYRDCSLSSGHDLGRGRRVFPIDRHDRFDRDFPRCHWVDERIVTERISGEINR